MIRTLFVFAAMAAAAGAQPAEEGKKEFASACAACHGGNGLGGERGPSLADVSTTRTSGEIEQIIANGIPGSAMPGFKLEPAKVKAITAFLSSIVPNEAPKRVKIFFRDGRIVEGLLRNENNYNLQMVTADGRMLLAARSEINSIERLKGDFSAVKRDAGGLPFERIAVPVAGDWPSYHGQLNSNRHSKLDQITAQNVKSLAAKWIYQIPGAKNLQGTPVVVDGVMYVTAPNEAHALDAATGRPIWTYKRTRAKGVAGDAGSGINRGVAVLENRLFMVTDHAHLIALDRFSGRLLWDVVMADSKLNYGATSAPLIARDLVISGISGGDEGARGFLAAYKPDTGERVWRTWTIPAPGEPLSETWKGKALEHGCGATWMTGSFDPLSNILYWQAGNPCPDFNGDDRLGDNLHSDSVLAFDPQTGAIKWHYQFTPHDEHDWDAQQPLMLLDSVWKGKPRKLLVQANRNGFFYVFDRITGELLLAKAFVKKLNWASHIGPDGRPVRLPNTTPTPQGVKACPAVEGATNWFSAAYNPATGLFYLQTLEKCNIYKKAVQEWKQGQSWSGGDTENIPGEPGQKILRALDIETAAVKWEYPQIGPADSWGGVLSTAGNLIFFCEDGGTFTASDAKTGKPLWNFETSQLWKASPMTYLARGKQHVAVAAGGSIISFGLQE